MNRSKIIQAAYFAVIAMDDKPSRRNVEKMIRCITGGKGFASLEVASWFKAHPQYALSYAQSSEPLQNHSRTTSEPVSEPVIEHESFVAQNQRQNEIENPSRVRAANEYLYTNANSYISTPVVAKATTPPREEKPKQPKVVVTVPEVVFEAQDEPRVAALVALHVKGDKMSAKVSGALRLAMRSSFESAGAAAWRYGVDTALAAGASWPYALKVIASNPNCAPPARLNARASPPPREVPINLQPDAEKLALYAKISREGDPRVKRFLESRAAQASQQENHRVREHQPNLLDRINPAAFPRSSAA